MIGQLQERKITNSDELPRSKIDAWILSSNKCFVSLKKKKNISFTCFNIIDGLRKVFEEYGAPHHTPPRMGGIIAELADRIIPRALGKMKHAIN